MTFFLALYNAPIKKVCVENPVGWPNTVFRSPDQIVEPYFFGDNHRKKTCLWLRGLPPLQSTKDADLFLKPTRLETPKPLYKLTTGKNVYFTDSRTGKDRQKQRSVTFPGIANAMAEQWG